MRLSYRVDIVEARSKNKLFKKKVNDLEEQIDEPVEKVISGDGFDELRKIHAKHGE